MFKCNTSNVLSIYSVNFRKKTNLESSTDTKSKDYNFPSPLAEHKKMFYGQFLPCFQFFTFDVHMPQIHMHKIHEMKLSSWKKCI